MLQSHLPDAQVSSSTPKAPRVRLARRYKSYRRQQRSRSPLRRLSTSRRKGVGKGASNRSVKKHLGSTTSSNCPRPLCHAPTSSDKWPSSYALESDEESLQLLNDITVDKPDRLVLVPLNTVMTEAVDQQGSRVSANNYAELEEGIIIFF